MFNATSFFYLIVQNLRYLWLYFYIHINNVVGNAVKGNLHKNKKYLLYTGQNA